MNIRIVLVDDHNVVRQGLRLLLEDDFEVVGEAEDGLEAVDLVERLRPEIVVMDLALPGLGGLDATEQILKRVPEARVVVLSMHSDEFHVLESLRRGASAYVLKEAGGECLIRAIHEAMSGRRYLSPPLSEESLETFALSSVPPYCDPLAVLSFREKQVAHMVAEGMNAREIAARLSISPRTVEAHRGSALRKLNLRNVLELVRLMNETRTLPGLRRQSADTTDDEKRGG